MLSVKIVLLLEYVRVGYISTKKGEHVLDFFNSNMGRKLRDYLRPYGLTPKDIIVEFAYPFVPEPSKVSRNGDPISYKNPPAAALKEPLQKLKERLVASEPDIVLPTGAIGSKLLTGVGAITKTRGVPVETTLEEGGKSVTFWTLPLYSIEFVSAQPNNEGMFKTDLGTLAKYLKDGDSAFIPNKVNSELVTSMERVEEIFTYIRTHKPLTAWDLETNTLHAEYKGAKVLVLSLATEEGKGITIPLEHHQTPFNAQQVERIYELIKEFVANPEVVKVGQNIQI